MRGVIGCSSEPLQFGMQGNASVLLQ